MSEKYTKGDGSQTANGDIPVVAPINMGLGLKYKSATKRYDVSFGADQPFKFNEKGEIEFKLSKTQGNLLRIADDGGVYYGIQAKASVANLYVDALNGVDQDPNKIEGAGTPSKPLRTLKYAMDLADNYTVRTIFLREGQEHIVSANDPISVKPGQVNVYPYGAMFERSKDGSNPRVTDNYTARLAAAREGYAPKILFRDVLETLYPTTGSGTKWNMYSYMGLHIGNDTSVNFNGVSFVNDVTSQLVQTNANQDYPFIARFARIVMNGGSLIVDGTSFERRGSTRVSNTTNKPEKLTQKDAKGFWQTGFATLGGHARSSFSLQNVYDSENYEEYLVAPVGAGIPISVLNSLGFKGTTSSWSAPRVYGVTKETQPSGDVIVLAPQTDLPNSAFI